MGFNLVHFSSETNEWTTPRGFFDRLDSEFVFDLDPCCTPLSAKCGRYFTEVEDGLAQEWTGSVFVNPPYGREIGRWVEKAWSSSQQGATVVLLMPVRSDTPYWHDFVMRASEVRLVRGRLRFSESEINAPFPCAVVVFKPYCDGAPVFSSMDR